jgi:hypothetical protein
MLAPARLTSDNPSTIVRAPGTDSATAAYFGCLEQLQLFNFFPRFCRWFGNEMIGKEQRHDGYQRATKHDPDDLDHGKTYVQSTYFNQLFKPYTFYIYYYIGSIL